MGNSVMLNGVEYAGEQIAYKDSTYELVSKVAYLIGVPLRIFQNEHEPPKIEIYNRLEQSAMGLSRDKITVRVYKGYIRKGHKEPGPLRAG